MIRPLDAAYAALLGVTSPVWGLSLLRTGKWRTDWRGRRGFAPTLSADTRPTVLLHAVSVGEVVAADPLARRLAAEGVRVVVSVTTETGLRRANELLGSDHEVVRFPLDFSWMVRRFLDRIRPDAVGLLELEVWPHFTAECERRGIPVSVVNGRLSASSYAGYRRFGPLVARAFRRLARVGAQSRVYADRFVELGVPPERVEVTGTMKWDVELPTDLAQRAAALRADLGVPIGKPVVAAISTGPREEAALLEALTPHATLVVVPRKPERFEEVARLTDWVRRSAHPAGSGPREPTGGPFLVDTMGEVDTVTALADVVVIGRTFDGLGGSNPMTAAALGRPIVSGPDHQNFAEVTAVLAPALRVVATPDRIPEVLSDQEALTRMAAAGPDVVTSERGAAGRNARIVLSMLSHRATDPTPH